MTALQRALVGWSRNDYPTRQYYCPPHVSRSQRTGGGFTQVTFEQAERLGARCETCGKQLAPQASGGQR